MTLYKNYAKSVHIKKSELCFWFCRRTHSCESRFLLYFLFLGKDTVKKIKILLVLRSFWTFVSLDFDVHFFICWFVGPVIKLRNLFVVPLVKKIRTWPRVEVLWFAKINTDTARYIHFGAFYISVYDALKTFWFFKRVSYFFLSFCFVKSWPHSISVKDSVKLDGLAWSKSLNNLLLKLGRSDACSYLKLRGFCL